MDWFTVLRTLRTTIHESFRNSRECSGEATPGRSAGFQARGGDMGDGLRRGHRLRLVFRSVAGTAMCENCCKPRRQSLRAIFMGLSSRFAAIRPNPRQAGFCSTLLFEASPMSMLSTVTYVPAPCLPTCCIADFRIGAACDVGRLAGLETRDTADLEVCATSAAAAPRCGRTRPTFSTASTH